MRLLLINNNESIKEKNIMDNKMTSSPLVSVIVPVYKVEAYLERCVNSVINQTYENLEIFLIDDGSPDKCPQLCDEFAKKDSRIKVIHKKNGGLSDARNAALDVITGDYCIFVDSDDFIHLDTITYTLQIATENNADIVQFNRELGSKDCFSQQPDLKQAIIKQYNAQDFFSAGVDQVTICMKLYKSSLWNGIRMPVGKLNEDDFTTWKLFYKSKVIVVTNLVLYYNYINPNGIMSGQIKTPNIIYPMEAYNERIDFFTKRGEDVLATLSKWRYSKYLLKMTGNPLLNKDDKRTLRKEFKSIYSDVMSCPQVPISNKCLMIMCLYTPRLCYSILNFRRSIKIKYNR